MIQLFLAVKQARAASCGDVDASARVDIGDAVYLVNYIFAGGGAPQDDAAGDLDCNGRADISDAVHLINYIFASGPSPCDGPLCEAGVLLAGDEDSLAVSVLFEFGPIAADSVDVAEDGFLRSRISALLHPDATVAEVNAALNAVGGKLTWTTPKDLLVTVAIAPVDGAAQADSIADLLIQSGAFLHAYPAYSLGKDAVVEFQELPPTGTDEIEHLIQLRMPAAWNVKGYAENVNSPVTVMVPDRYYRAIPHAEIPSQTFLSGRGKPDLIVTSTGNHGFAVSGIIGAEHDIKNTTGVHPGPTTLLGIKSLMVGGLSPSEATSDIVARFPAGRFVLNTSLGFEVDIATYPKLERVIDALKWRAAVWPRQADFIHIASAGNSGDRTDASRYASISSQFNIAAAFGSPFDIYSPGEATLAESFILQNYVNYLIFTNQYINVRLTNVIVVGSSDAFGNEHPWSGAGAPVRVLGEWVSAPCARIDNPAEVGGCEQSAGGDLISHYQGTSFAAPQVAGLAAYLLSLNPTLTNLELKNIVQKAFDESPYAGFVDGYLAVLMLDADIFTAPIRKTLLDVADQTGAEGADGFFDEFDIDFLTKKFADYELVRQGNPNALADYSRYDLNGDGFTGGSDKITKFDLDINSPPAFTAFSQQVANKTRKFDESSVSDLEVLCYYAYTPLFSGDEAVRDSLLVDCPACDSVARDGTCPNLWVIEADFPTFIQFTAPLHVRVGQQSDTGIVWRDGVEVQMLASGGTVSPTVSTTGSDGSLGVVATLANGADEIVIAISALEDSSVVATTTVQAINIAPVVLSNVEHFSHADGSAEYLDATSATSFAPLSFGANGLTFGNTAFYTASAQAQTVYNAGVDFQSDARTLTFYFLGSSTSNASAAVTDPPCDDHIGISGMVSFAGGTNRTKWEFGFAGGVDSIPYTLIVNTIGLGDPQFLSEWGASSHLLNEFGTIAGCQSGSLFQSGCADTLSGYLHGFHNFELNVSLFASSSSRLNPECNTSSTAFAQSSVKLIIELPEAVKRKRTHAEYR